MDIVTHEIGERQNIIILQISYIKNKKFRFPSHEMFEMTNFRSPRNMKLTKWRDLREMKI